MKKFIALTLALFLYAVSTLNSNVVNQFWVPSVYKGDGQFEHPKTITPLLDPIQLDCMAKNIYFEAATQSTAGKLAVAFVTKNRVDSTHFPSTFCDVIYEGPHYASGHPKRDRCQFSWYCDGMGDNPREGYGWRNSQSVAKWFYDHKDRLMDITDGATHYHANWMEKFPKWSKKYKKNVTIDDHIFYKRSYNF